MGSAYQMIAVPETALPAVYRLLANHTAGGGHSEKPTGNPVVAELTENVPEFESDEFVLVEGNGWWLSDHMLELSQMLKNPAGIEMMNTIAENSLEGQPTTYEELREAGQEARDGEFGYDHVRAQLSWIAKYCKAIQGENVWPMTFTDLGPDVEKGARYQYLMPAELAESWLIYTGERER